MLKSLGGGMAGMNGVGEHFPNTAVSRIGGLGRIQPKVERGGGNLQSGRQKYSEG